MCARRDHGMESTPRVNNGAVGMDQTIHSTIQSNSTLILNHVVCALLLNSPWLKSKIRETDFLTL